MPKVPVATLTAEYRSQIFGLKVGMQQAERKLSMQCRRGCVMEDTRHNGDINNVISIFHALENDGSK